MKILVKIIILVLALYVCYSIMAQGQSVNVNESIPDNPDNEGEYNTVKSKPGRKIDKKSPNLKEYEYDNTGVEEDDFFSYDLDFLTRKLFQKKLPPLTRKERIIWSFRMADSNAFL